MGKEKSKKRRKSSHSSDGSPDSSKVRKLKKKLRKEKRRAEKALKQKLKAEKLKFVETKGSSQENAGTSNSQDEALDVPLHLMERSKSMAPMTKEEWEKRQSVVRKVLDEESGRYRLIKGDGEVLEEIVSRDRHKDINRRATQADGDYFQSHLNKR